MRNFSNTWDNKKVSESYSRLEFPNTYYLAYRDLPIIISRHVKGKKAIDFGCGTGRSTRFLRKLGFEVTGIDISRHMLNEALSIDPTGDYRLVTNGKYDNLGTGQYDLILSVFTFDNIPGWELRSLILKSLLLLLAPEGKIICLDSTPELYINEWASFSTFSFPENRNAVTGDIVKDIVTDVDDKTVCEDILWSNEDYLKLFSLSGLETEATYRPLGREDEPFKWVSETKIAPWVIYVTRRKNSD